MLCLMTGVLSGVYESINAPVPPEKVNPSIVTGWVVLIRMVVLPPPLRVASATWVPLFGLMPKLGPRRERPREMPMFSTYVPAATMMGSQVGLSTAD